MGLLSLSIVIPGFKHPDLAAGPVIVLVSAGPAHQPGIPQLGKIAGDAPGGDTQSLRQIGIVRPAETLVVTQCGNSTIEHLCTQIQGNAAGNGDGDFDIILHGYTSCENLSGCTPIIHPPPDNF